MSNKIIKVYTTTPTLAQIIDSLDSTSTQDGLSANKGRELAQSISDLETTQTDLVSAVNENTSSIGDLSDLETTVNTDLVSSINEVNSNTDINTAKLNGTQAAGDIVVDSIRSKNMFNKNTITPSHYVNKDNGNLVYSGVNNSSDFIKISGQYIVVSGGYDGDTYALYNSSKTYLSGGTYTNGTAIDVTNASYIRITVKPAVIDTFQLEYGTAPTTYKPYQELNPQLATTSTNGLMSYEDKDLLDQLDTKRFATRVSDTPILDGGTQTFTVKDNGKYIFFNAHPYRTGADFLNIHPNLGLNATNIFGSTTMTYTLNGTTLTIKSEGQCRGWLFVLNMWS